MRFSKRLHLHARLAFMACLIASLGLAMPVWPAGAFSNPAFEGWSSVVVAADWRNGEGQPIEAFDNARRDLSAGLLDLGFPADHHASLTLNPSKPDGLSPREALSRINAAHQSTSKGCFFYLTSHGTPSNIVFGDTRGLQPVDLASLLRHACGTRPTIVVLSACFSGSFVDALKAPNRMILTAARRDRTSFGCGEGDTYPWFDACIIETLPKAVHFLDLAGQARDCVTRREREAHVALPSEPQLYIGPEMQLRLPILRFRPSS